MDERGGNRKGGAGEWKSVIIALIAGITAIVCVVIFSGSIVDYKKTNLPLPVFHYYHYPLYFQYNNSPVKNKEDFLNLAIPAPLPGRSLIYTWITAYK